LLVRKTKHAPAVKIKFRNLWGKNKREELAIKPSHYEALAPALEIGLSLVPGQIAVGYLGWPLLTELFPDSYPGVKTSRDDFLVNIDRFSLEERINKYFDSSVSNEEIGRVSPRMMEEGARYNPKQIRAYLLERGFLPKNIIRYYYRPFDIRWLYWEPETKLLDEKRPEYFPQIFDANVWMTAVQQNRKQFDAPIVTMHLCSLHLIERGANLFPLFVNRNAKQTGLFESMQNNTNLSKEAVGYLKEIKVTSIVLFHHLLSVLHSLEYAGQNAGALCSDWPRIPLPKKKETLLASAELGKKVAALLDTESPVPGVSSGKIREDLKPIAVFERLDGKPAKPERGDLDLTAGWGHGGKGGVTMPGRGKTMVRPDGALDIHMNDVACWRNIPEAVWEYTIGGYQVIKKWLSYREKPLLGRGLKPEEVRYVTEMARRIAALVSLRKDLDENYRAVTKSTYLWPKR
jgi:predicted helicase